MNNLRVLFCALAASVALAASGDATVTVDALRTRYPWNGLVDIDYTIAGVDNPGDYTLAITVSATVDGTARTWQVATFHDALAVDLPTHDGSHRVTWNASADGAVFAASDVSAQIDLVYSPCDPATAEYLVVDLSPGPTASVYPVRYLKGLASSAFNIDRYKTTKLVMKRIAACGFWMGVNTTPSTVIPPYRYVQLTKDYYLGLFEVTQRQYALVMGTNPSQFAEAAESARRPVERTSWDMLQAADGFIARMKARAVYAGTPLAGMDLPTEAQWERAARGEYPTWSWISSNNPAGKEEFSWVLSNSDGRTHVVGTRPKVQNWGFYDIVGNVSEICRDFNVSAARSGTKEAPDRDPCAESVNGSTLIVVRGASHVEKGNDAIRVDKREPREKAVATSYTGFRLSYTCP